MKFSDLQKFILKMLWDAKNYRLTRNVFLKFYDKQTNPPQKDLRAKIITQSLERLIDKGLLTGYGERTRFKWFITEVRLTPLGKKWATRLQGQQSELPFRKRKKN